MGSNTRRWILGATACVALAAAEARAQDEPQNIRCMTCGHRSSTGSSGMNHSCSGGGSSSSGPSFDPPKFRSYDEKLSTFENMNPLGKILLAPLALCVSPLFIALNLLKGDLDYCKNLVQCNVAVSEPYWLVPYYICLGVGTGAYYGARATGSFLTADAIDVNWSAYSRDVEDARREQRAAYPPARPLVPMADASGPSAPAAPLRDEEYRRREAEQIEVARRQLEQERQASPLTRIQRSISQVEVPPPAGAPAPETDPRAAKDAIRALRPATGEARFSDEDRRSAFAKAIDRHVKPLARKAYEEAHLEAAARSLERAQARVRQAAEGVAKEARELRRAVSGEALQDAARENAGMEKREGGRE